MKKKLIGGIDKNTISLIITSRRKADIWLEIVQMRLYPIKSSYSILPSTTYNKLAVNDLENSLTNYEQISINTTVNNFKSWNCGKRRNQSWWKHSRLVTVFTKVKLLFYSLSIFVRKPFFSSLLIFVGYIIYGNVTWSFITFNPSLWL